MNTDDRDAERYLKLFTALSQDEITALLRSHHKDPGRREAQKQLALDVTQLVHGDAALAAAVASEIVFGEFDPQAANERVFDTLAQEIPTNTVASEDSLTLVDAVVRAGLAKSKSEARRSIEQGGIYLNQQRVKDVDRRIAPGDWLADRNILLRKGKKDYALLRVERGR
jgi:tyrosyl-tRNA synthetase